MNDAQKLDAILAALSSATSPAVDLTPVTTALSGIASQLTGIAAQLTDIQGQVDEPATPASGSSAGTTAATGAAS